MALAARIILTILGCWLFGAPADALDPERSIGQYKHTRWTIDDGAPRSVSVLAQGASGYLWIGSSTGLYRFDGVSFTPIRLADGNPVAGVSALLVSREGDVWIGHATGGSTMFSRGTLREIAMPVSDFVMDMVQTPDRSIWATLGRNRNQLARYQNGRWADVAGRYGFPAEQPIKMIVARDGTIWVTALKSFWYLRPGSPRFVRVNATGAGHASPTEDRFGNIWLSDGTGTRIAAPGGRPLPQVGPGLYPTPTAKRRVVTLFDRDDNLWGRSDNGIYRVRPTQLEAPTPPRAPLPAIRYFQQADGLLTNEITDLFEDREGNLWAGSAVGLERFRPARVVAEPAMTNKAFWGDTLLRAADGSVYVGEADMIYRIRPGGSPEPFLRADETQALCEGPTGTIWIVLQDSAVRSRNGRFDRIAVPPDMAKNIADCAVDRHGMLWLAALNHGLFGQAGATWRQYMTPPSSEAFPPKFFLSTADRKLLIGYETRSLAAFDPPHPARFLNRPDASLGPIKTALEANGGLLIGSGSGLGLVRGDTVHMLTAWRFPEFRSVAGIVQTNRGETWLSSSAGIVGLSTAKLMRAFADVRAPLAPLVLDFRDGLMGVQSRDANRAAVEGGDGRIWFATGAGTVWIDPAHLPRNAVPPPTAISALKAAGVTHLDPAALSLPAGTSSVQLDYSALSLTIPERVRVRYRLEGADRDWIDPGMRRQAFYTNLGPGHYVFRVIAANNDGVWNRTGSTLRFDIPPTFLQSNWFLALCILGISALLWGAYQLRIRQVRAKMRATLEERLAERERIARDLHDTLLQGFQGLILRFQSIANQMPREHIVRRSMEQALDSADDVLAEGRDSVLHLRAAHATDLSEAFATVAERLRHEHSAEFELVVEGAPRALHPVAHEEICRIGEEALINAFQHAQAKKIELAIAYGASALTLGIRDDGVGIAPDIFASGGRRGHFGLTGMRERASQIDAQFTISSGPDKGTEISVTVPGRVAFAVYRGGRLSERLRGLLDRTRKWDR